MKIRKWLLAIVLMVAGNVHAEDRIARLEQRVAAMAAEIVQLKRERAMSTPTRDQRSDAGRRDSNTTRSDDDDIVFVDLESEEIASFADEATTHVLASPWWRNIDISGFGAAGFYDTGSAGTRDHGGFEIKEASLFIDAEVWENLSFFFEFQTNRLGRDGDQFTRTGEVHVHARNIVPSADTPIGLKLGRIDVPFGEEYLWQDAIDNPLITNSAAYVYATDEGLMLYSSVRGVHWIASVTDGLLFRGREENSDKALNLKFFGNPTESLYLSASYMNNGDSSLSALQFAGSFIQPVGARHQSTLGASPSSEVNSEFYSVNGRYDFRGDWVNGYVALSAGRAEIDDKDPQFDRDFRWFAVEPLVTLGDQYYVVARYSEIGTYDDDEGYHFDGKTFAGGNTAFGYDTQRLRRLGLGFGWTPNPRLKAKVEIGKDWFDVIDASVLETNNSDRTFAALEVAVKL